jgi:alkylation response protein AidB-like acyl-CoA dehydrogenase
MNSRLYSVQNINFMLYEVADVLQLTTYTYFAAHNRDSFDMVLTTAENIAEKNMRPFYKESDKQPPELINGKVSVHPAIHPYYKIFCESGLLAASFDEQYGGQQLPKTVYALADFIVGNAHNGFEMFTSLSAAAARLLTNFATAEIINNYALKILSGKYTATMCLTETGAGSSLSDINTIAYRQPNGSYKIKGQKIFISAGDHNITENIVHLVLAKTEDAPEGVKGISLFVVPKIIDDNCNGVSSIGIYHKMGQRSTPAMHLAFGEKNNCTGYLVGEEGKGLFYMFQMMNTARLGVGLAGTYIATAAYYTSLQYANERIQGRRLNNKEAAQPPVAIIHHPDVRRMLLLQKAIAEGSLSLLLQCYKYTDLEKISTPDAKQRYTELLELLTPVAKTYGAEMGIVSVNNGLQVLGGYGYTEDFMLEQMARDVRIMSLYEGTTGIQSQALLGRQIPLNNARALHYWKDEVNKTIEEAQHFNNLQHYADWLLNEVQQLEITTVFLLNVARQSGTEIFLSDACLYMELFGLVTVAWQWLLQAIAAQRCIEKNSSVQNNLLFYQSKIETMQFFFHYELRKTTALHQRLTDEAGLTIYKNDEILM